MKKKIFLSALLIIALLITTLYSSVATYKEPANEIFIKSDAENSGGSIGTVESIMSSGPTFVEYKDKRYRITQKFEAEINPTDLYLGSTGFGSEPQGDYKLISNGYCEVYTLKDFNPEYLICTMNESGYVYLCPSIMGVSAARGEDIYIKLLNFNEKEFKLKYTCSGTYEAQQSEYYTLPDTEGYKIRTLIRAMCDAPFVDRSTTSREVINDYNKYYNFSFVTKNGVELYFTYTDNGYIYPMFLGIEYLQKLPDKIRDKVNAMLSDNMKPINLRDTNEVYIGNNLYLLQSDTEASRYLPSYLPKSIEFKMGFCTYNDNKVENFRLNFNEGDNEQRPHFTIEKISKEKAAYIPSKYHKTQKDEFDLELIDIYTTEQIYRNSKKEKEIDYFLDVSVEYEDCYILYSSSFISPEESYKILSSINP